MLFGEYDQTRERWKAILKSAWLSGSWVDTLAAVPTNDVRQVPGEIIYDIGNGPIDLQCVRPQWWVSYIDSRPIRSKRTEIITRDQTLIRAGLRYLWYTAGLLGKHVQLPRLSITAVATSTEEFHSNQRSLQQAIAEAIAHWLPELNFLGNRLSLGAIPAYFVQICSSRPPYWLQSAFQTFVMAYGAPEQAMGPLWRSFYREHGNEPIRFLQEIELIENDGDRFRPASRLTRLHT